MMRKMPFSLLFSILLTLIIFFYSVLKKEIVFIPLILLILLLQVEILFRLRRFVEGLSRLIKSLQQNEFSVEFKEKERDLFANYLRQLAFAIKKSGEFEKLRRDRVLLYYRALRVLLRRVKEPVIWIDLEEDFFRLNPASQKLFGVEQEEYKLSGILNLPDNSLFSAWLDKVVKSEEIVPNEIACDISLPVSKRAQVLYIDAVVIRTGEEKAKIVFLFLKTV